MKRIIVLCLLFSTACTGSEIKKDDVLSNSNDINTDSSVDDNTNISDQKDVQENTTEEVQVWIVEPQYTFDNVDIVNSKESYITADSKMNGSDYTACYANVDDENGIANMINCYGYYDNGFVKVSNGGQYAIYDFAGNVIRDFSDRDYEYGYTYVYDSNIGSTNIYHGYFTSTEVLYNNGPIDYYDINYYGEYFEQDSYQKGDPRFAVNGLYIQMQNGDLQCFSGYGGTCDVSSAINKSNGAVLIYGISDSYDQEYYVYNQYTGQIVKLNGYVVDGISNEYIRVTNKHILLNDQGTSGVKYGFDDIYGNVITDFIFDNAYDFTDGYAAVEQNGMWGYIDTSGNTVIPFEFEETRPVYEGKAWVKKDGLWGVLDINAYIKNQSNENASSTAISTVQNNIAKKIIDMKDGTYKLRLKNDNYLYEGFPNTTHVKHDDKKPKDEGAWYDRDNDLTGYQCYGFAKVVFYELFNHTFAGIVISIANNEAYHFDSLGRVEQVGQLVGSDVNAESVKNLLYNNAKPGDVIQMSNGSYVSKTGSNTKHHTMIVGESTNEDSLYIYDNNWNDDCVNHYELRTYAEIANYIGNANGSGITLYRAENYDEINNQ